MAKPGKTPSPIRIPPNKARPKRQGYGLYALIGVHLSHTYDNGLSDVWAPYECGLFPATELAEPGLGAFAG